TAYIINLATIRANPGLKSGELVLELDARVNGMLPGPPAISVSGCPDIPPVSDTFDGTLDSFITSLPAGPRQSYFEGFRFHVQGKLDEVAAKLTPLTNSTDEHIGRCARREMRIVRYFKRSAAPVDDFALRRITALYLCKVGFLAQAYEEARFGARYDRDSAS